MLDNIDVMMGIAPVAAAGIPALVKALPAIGAGIWGGLKGIFGGGDKTSPQARQAQAQGIGGILNTTSQTPPWNPNAPAPGGGLPTGGGSMPGGNMPGGFDWTQALPDLVGAGSNILGTYMQSRSQGKQNDAIRQRMEMLDKLARDEMARRDFYGSMVMPNLMRGTGYSRDQAQAALPNMANRPF